MYRRYERIDWRRRTLGGNIGNGASLGVLERCQDALKDRAADDRRQNHQ